MKDDIEILIRSYDPEANNTVSRAMDKAIAVMRAWEKLRLGIKKRRRDYTIYAKDLAEEMDRLVPPGPVDELDELCERVRSSTGTAQVSIDLGLLSLIIAEIKAGRK